MRRPGLDIHAKTSGSPGPGIVDCESLRKLLAIDHLMRYFGLDTLVPTELTQINARHPMKILVVDDHALIREAMRGALGELEGVAEVSEASDGRECMQVLAQNGDLDLVLLDLSLPDRDGFDVLADIRAHHPSVGVVVMSALQDRDNVVKALELGASGFIPKSAQRKVILGALALVISGGIYIPPQILAPRDASDAAHPAPQSAATPTAALSRPAASPADLGLTERQVDVLALMMQGKSNKAICRALNLAEPTVKNHVTAILKALKVTNRTEAVITAGEMKWDLPTGGVHRVIR
jgi:DNA-binding NarL/FixJ family response regulator